MSLSTAHLAVSESSDDAAPSCDSDESPQLLPTFIIRDLIVSQRTLEIWLGISYCLETFNLMSTNPYQQKDKIQCMLWHIFSNKINFTLYINTVKVMDDDFKDNEFHIASYHRKVQHQNLKSYLMPVLLCR